MRRHPNCGIAILVLAFAESVAFPILLTTEDSKVQPLSTVDSKPVSAAPRRQTNGSNNSAAWAASGKASNKLPSPAQRRDHVSELITEDNGDARLEFRIGDQIAVVSGNYSNYGTHSAVKGYVVQVCDPCFLECVFYSHSGTVYSFAFPTRPSSLQLGSRSQSLFARMEEIELSSRGRLLGESSKAEFMTSV